MTRRGNSKARQAARAKALARKGRKPGRVPLWENENRFAFVLVWLIENLTELHDTRDEIIPRSRELAAAIIAFLDSNSNVLPTDSASPQHLAISASFPEASEWALTDRLTNRVKYIHRELDRILAEATRQELGWFTQSAGYLLMFARLLTIRDDAVGLGFVGDSLVRLGWLPKLLPILEALAENLIRENDAPTAA